LLAYPIPEIGYYWQIEAWPLVGSEPFPLKIALERSYHGRSSSQALEYRNAGPTIALLQYISILENKLNIIYLIDEGRQTKDV